jgi:hypothetical protein
MKPKYQRNDMPAVTDPSNVWLDKQDILQRMCISSRTLQQWRRKKILPYSRIGGKIYYLESDLLEMLEKGKVQVESTRHSTREGRSKKQEVIKKSY